MFLFCLNTKESCRYSSRETLKCISRWMRKTCWFLPKVRSVHLHHFCISVRSFIFTRWYRVMFWAGATGSTDNPLQRSDEDKKTICVRIFFLILLKSLSQPGWSLTPSFCFSFVCDTEGHKVCHSEVDIVFCGPRFEYVRLQSHGKEVRSSHASIFWRSEAQGMVWIFIPSIPRKLINWGLCPNQLVYLTVRQYPISLIDDWL